MKQGDHKGVVVASAMEGWIDKLGEAEGPESIEPGRGSRICGGKLMGR